MCKVFVWALDFAQTETELYDWGVKNKDEIHKLHEYFQGQIKKAYLVKMEGLK